LTNVLNRTSNKVKSSNIVSKRFEQHLTTLSIHNSIRQHISQKQT